MFGRKKKTHSYHIESYNSSTHVPAVRSSICTGEQVAGFKEISTGRFEEVMLIQNSGDLQAFREQYGIEGEIEKIY